MSINKIGTNIPIEVTKGGTGVAANATPYGVICSGTTNTNPLQNIVSVGTATQALTSNGAGLLPTFQDQASGVVPPYVAPTAFVPSIVFAGANTGVTYAVRSGYYMVVGSLAYVSINIQLTSKGTSTGALTIINVPPFGPISSEYNSGAQTFRSSIYSMNSVPSSNIYAALSNNPQAGFDPGIKFLYPVVGTGTSVSLNNTHISNSTQFVINMCYIFQ
jgi:hypothetical protein